MYKTHCIIIEQPAEIFAFSVCSCRKPGTNSQGLKDCPKTYYNLPMMMRNKTIFKLCLVGTNIQKWHFDS